MQFNKGKAKNGTKIGPAINDAKKIRQPYIGRILVHTIANNLKFIVA
jgi:hypothetical protein